MMRYIILLVLLLSSIVISGCSTKHEVITRPIDKPALDISDPDALTLKRFKFIVITPENASEVFESLEALGEEPVLFAVTGDGYKSLSINMKEIQNYILLQKKIIILYRDYYEGENND